MAMTPPDPPDAAALIQRAQQLPSVNMTREASAWVEDVLALLTARETALHDMQDERDAAIVEHGAESGFWGRAAARATSARKAAEAKVTALEAALATAQQERDKLKQALNPSGSVTTMDGLLNLIAAFRSDSETMDELQDNDQTIREALAERDALRDQVAQRERGGQ